MNREAGGNTLKSMRLPASLPTSELEVGKAYLRHAHARFDRKIPAECDPEYGWKKGAQKCVRTKKGGISTVGVAVGVGAGAGIALALKAGGHDTNLPSLVSRKEAAELSPTGQRPPQGWMGISSFVRNPEGKTFFFKEMRIPLLMVEGAMETTVSEMAEGAGIPVPKTRLIPKGRGNGLDRYGFGGTLSEVVDGSTVKELQKKGLESSGFEMQKPGSNFIKTIQKSEDLARIAALDAFTGNSDRHSGNVMKLKGVGKYYGIDNGGGYHFGNNEVALSQAKFFSSKKRDDFSPEELNAIKVYRDTLHALQRDNPPEKIENRVLGYLAHEGARLHWRRTAYRVVVRWHYNDSQKLLRELDRVLTRTDSVRLDRRAPAKCDPKSGWERGNGKCVRVKAAPSVLKAVEKGKGGKKVAAVAGSAIAATILAGFGGHAALRMRYQQSFDKNAPSVLARSQEIAASGNLKVNSKQKAILIGLGGMAYAEDSPETVSGQRMILSAKMSLSLSKKHGFKSIPVSAEDDYPKGKAPSDKIRWTRDALKYYARNLTRGGTSAGKEAAAQAIAWGDANPSTPIVMIGHSAGGTHLFESLEYIRRVRPDLAKRVKAFALGTENFGLTDPEKIPGFHTLGSPNDFFTSALPTKKLQSFPDVKGHALGDYMRGSPSARRFMLEQIWGKEQADELLKKEDLQKKAADQKSGRKDSAWNVDYLLTRLDRRPLAKCDPKRGWKRGPSGKCIRVKRAEVVSPKKGEMVAASLNKYEINPETGQPYRIRELRGLAREKGVVGYGSMTTSQMQSAMNLIDENPTEAQKRNLVKTLSRDRSYPGRALNAGLGSLRGRSKAEKELYKDARSAAQTWKRVEAVLAFAGAAPVKWGVLAAGAAVAGTTLAGWETLKHDYRKGLPESAKIAAERARRMNVRPPTDANPSGQYLRRFPSSPEGGKQAGSENITFVVGGGRNRGAQEMVDMMKGYGKSPDATEGDKWISKNNFVPFDLRESGSRKSSQSGGFDESIEMMGDFFRNHQRGRNQDAVDLASSMLAYSMAYPDKKLNIVAHSSGGLAAKEALEIISKVEIKRPGQKKIVGVDLVKNINVVMLGTPDFGYTETVAPNTRTITSPKDPMSKIPFFGWTRRPQWISSVKGHSSKSYLSDPYVRESIRESFGYYRAENA